MVVLRFCGVVQGVGFRPLVYRTATELGLCGGVYNDHSNAIVLISPKKHLKLRAIKPMRLVRFYPCATTLPCATALLDPSALESSMRLLDSLLPKLPALASISHIAIYPLYKAFSIIPSLAAIDLSALQATFHILPSYLSTHLSSCSPNHLPNHSPNSPSISPTLPTIPTDSATCNDCLQEIFSPTSRFYHYHLCACTNCGARYSIIDSLPYDRARTSMRDFPLCAACKQDFRTPSSRFYHAQPISCNACSIELRLVDSRTNSVLARDYAGIELCARLLAQGEIVCIKGLGGFALICDSANEQAIARLRERKNRPHKPFAIMCKNLAQARELADLCKEEEDALTSLAAPIVLARIKSKAKPTPKPQKPELNTIGIVLANTPLHHLLLDIFPNPIIYTSANLESQPIITTAQEAASLAHITPYVLDIDREILHGIDDSIVRYIDSQIRPIRLARGQTPHITPLPCTNTAPLDSRSIIALGAGEKITPTLATATHAILTPYLGSLQSPKSLARLEDNLSVFLPHIPAPTLIISDTHPRFETTTLAHNLAKEHSATHLSLYHHHAHHCAIWGEMARDETERILSIVWDGSGLGADGSIWGGEFLLGDCREIARVGHFMPFALLGGERAITEPKRIAYILAKCAGHSAMIARYEQILEPPLIALAELKPPVGHTTSSVGRLIDGVAHLLGLVDSITYQGQAGALLESIAQEAPTKDPYPYTITHSGIIQWQEMIAAICDDALALESSFATQESTLESTFATKAHIAYKFLYTLAHIAKSFALRIIADGTRVGLSGGVFQNKLLCEILGSMLKESGITYSYHTLVPCNDGGIAFGQAIFASRVMLQYPNPR
ncbi:carbamoyltransferase HypF [Helicobacter zhangjianzhongii]|uniref:Carbamoyltransferase HypF n=1 Tax=Helicobacter zhangjianzhongii TaxID=2974574 RepID=A0ACC6FUM7_9HELI|nr:MULTISPECIES: carbamoyltransferase HypF [unclassified Helicobacter]MDL0080673.1 carbamoyltransferase HypF [Helicobacter sp. CPD2-1]MDL0082612.1 carbamoyltransferase HypF [Helicobacter sp. XJK30-2]